MLSIFRCTNALMAHPSQEEKERQYKELVEKQKSKAQDAKRMKEEEEERVRLEAEERWKKREEEVGAEQDAFKRFVRNSRIFCALLKAWIMTTIRESLRDVGEVKSIVPDIGGAFIVSVLLGVWGKRRELRRLREEARLLSDEEEAAEEEVRGCDVLNGSRL